MRDCSIVKSFSSFFYSFNLWEKDFHYLFHDKSFIQWNKIVNDDGYLLIAWNMDGSQIAEGCGYEIVDKFIGFFFGDINQYIKDKGFSIILDVIFRFNFID